MTRSAQLSFGLAVLATLLQSGMAEAQDAGLQIANLSGTLQAMQLNQIKIVAEDKKEYFAVVSEKTSLAYKGTAGPDFLTPGLFVRFSAELNKNGEAQGPVTELEVFTINQNQIASPEPSREQTPGVYQVGGEVGNAKKTADKPKEKTGSKNKAASAKSALPYRVVGQIQGTKEGKMFVQAGGVQVQLELDPKAEIKVTANNTTFSQKGDQVKVSGLRAAGDQFIRSEVIEIIGAKPLEPAEGKTAKNSKTTKGSKGKAAKTGADKDNASDDSKVDSKKTDTKKPTPKK